MEQLPYSLNLNEYYIFALMVFIVVAITQNYKKITSELEQQFPNKWEEYRIRNILKEEVTKLEENCSRFTFVSILEIAILIVTTTLSSAEPASGVLSAKTMTLLLTISSSVAASIVYLPVLCISIYYTVKYYRKSIMYREINGDEYNAYCVAFETLKRNTRTNAIGFMIPFIISVAIIIY